MGVIKSVLVVLLLLVAIFFGFRLLTPEDSWVCEDGVWQQHGKPSSPMPTSHCEKSTIKVSPSTSPDSSPTKTISNLKDYTSSKLGFSTKLPPEVKISENLDNSVSFFKWGPTQKTATELYDGFSVNVSQGTMGSNKNLKSLIEADIEQNTEQLSPDFKVVEPISSKYNGFTYKAQDVFGEIIYFYLPQENDRFLLISVMVKDPGKSEFAKNAEDIIAAITMSK